MIRTVPAVTPVDGAPAYDPSNGVFAIAAADARVRKRAVPVPVLRGISVGGPRHEVAQDEVKAAAISTFPNVSEGDSITGVFDNAQIDTRQFAKPLDWYVSSRPFAEKNAVYVDEALALSERIATEALEQAGIVAADVDAVVFVSSTGISTPSLDSYLIQKMGIDPAAARLPLWGLGCAGGAAGLARAADMVRAGYEHVLLISVEFCSLTFIMDDDSKGNFIGTAIFADGGAALVLGPEHPATGTGDRAAGSTNGHRNGNGHAPSGPAPLMRIVSAHSHLIDDSAALTGWDVVEAGFKLRLSPEIPALVAKELRPAVDASLEQQGWTLDSVDHVIVHPGGAKVIDGYTMALGLDEHALDATRTVLREHGNMSSPTVLFVLAETLKGNPTGRGLISATGPGFSAEHLLVEFPE